MTKPSQKRKIISKDNTGVIKTVSYNSNGVDLYSIILRLRKMMKYMWRKSRNDYGYFLDDKRATDGKFSYDWPELLFLRRNLLILSRLLIKLPLSVRRLVIMRNEIIGVTKDYLNTKYSVNNDLMTYFSSIKEHEDEIDTAGIREILPSRKIPLEFFAFVALMARIPMHWLTMEDVECIWTVEHFRQRCDAVLIGKHSLNDFLDKLNPNIHDVWAIIFKSNPKEPPLYLRIECLYGSITVELCNEKTTAYECRKFEMLFTKRRDGLVRGYMSTVIHKQINPAIMFRHHLSQRPICRPIEFKEISHFFK